MSNREAVLKTSPQWLQGYVGSRIGFSTGIIFDALLDWLDQGVKSRFPAYGTPTANLYLGNDRNLEKFPGETNEEYGERLQDAIATWKTCGSARSIIDQVKGYLQPYTDVDTGGNQTTVAIVNNTGTRWYIWDPNLVADNYYVETTSSEWDWDGEDTRWWRCWVLIWPGLLGWEAEADWGDPGDWGEDGVWGIDGATISQVSAIRRLIKRWKPANVAVMSVIVSMEPYESAFWPGGANPTSGEYANWSINTAGTQVPSRSESGRYMQGVF